MITSLYFTVNKNLPDPSGPLSKILPSSSIEAANAKVSVLLIEPQNPEEKVVGRGPYCQHGSSSLTVHVQMVDMPTNHRFNTEGHSPAAVLSCGCG